MISLIDIQNAITVKLKKSFIDHTIYVEENKKEIATPAFFVEVRPLITDQFVKYKNRLINVDIMYFSKNSSKRENLLMTEKLEELFYLILKVKERKLHTKKVKIKEINDVLNCSFTLDFNTDVNIKYDPESDLDLGYTDENTEYMQTLYMTDKEGNEI